MKVILLQDGPKFGKKSDVKDVADGFGRNYLIPKGLAKPATTTAVGELEGRRAEEAKQAEEELARAQAEALVLDGIEVEIHAKANEQGELYAQVPTKAVAEALNTQGHNITQKQITISEPIKRVGEHVVKVVFNDGIEAEVRVVVTPEADPVVSESDSGTS